ncbi:MAG TPA: hypothetical protein VHF47_08785 [Acidimicrobiales bacterium]|nr:hypothetical protein [Acidimicrobiales bacterium]
MASPQDRTPYHGEAPLAKGQGADDDFDLPTDDATGVSLPPSPVVPILPPDRVAPY